MIITKLKIIILVSCLCLVIKAQSPSWQWAHGSGGTGSDNGTSIVVDASGNSYTTGYFYSSTIVFGTYTLTNAGNYDMYIVKYNSAGNVVWATSAGGAFDEAGSGITRDAFGNILVTGYFTSQIVVFDTYTLTNSGGTDIFIVKYDPAGNILWAAGAGDSNSEEGNNIACDNIGNVFVTGSFQSSTLTFGSYTLTNNGIADVYLAKYSSSGLPLWAVSFGDVYLDNANDLAVDGTGNIYMCGNFSSPTVAVGSITLTNSSGANSDMFIAKFDNSGTAVWAQSAGGNFDDMAYGLTLDPMNNLLVTGYYKSQTITFGSVTFTNSAIASCDIFLVKYDNAGNVIWSRTAGGAYDEIGYDVCCDQLANVFITGHLHSTSMVFSTYTLTNQGIGDSFIAIYDSNGNEVWADNVGGFSDDGTSGIAINQTGEICISGYFFSSSFMVGSNSLNNSGSADVLIAKLGYVTTDIAASENKDELFFDLFPNPSQGSFTVFISEEAEHKMQYDDYAVKIYDVYGKIVCDIKIKSTEKIDLSKNKSGIYFVQLVSNGNQVTKRLVLL